MKICFIATGDSIHSFRWVDFFADRGHEVHWISLTPFLKPANSNSVTHEMPVVRNEFLQIIQSLKLVKELLKQLQPDILHMHSAGRHGLLGSLSRFHPSVVTAWGSEILIAGKSVFKRPLIKYILKNTDLITCDAEHMLQAIQKLGVQENKIKIVYFGTDVNKFCSKEKNIEILQSLNAYNAPVIMSLRSLEPIYDIKTLIKAIPHVLREHPNAIFFIVGKGSQREQLINLAQEIGIESNIRFIGEIANELLPVYLNCADVYVSTSLSDAGLAASTAEAMACGLSAVVTDSGENKLWVKENEGGFVVPVQAPEALAKKIIYLLKNPSICRQFGQFNRNVIEKKNNYYIEMGKMEKLYESLAEQCGKI
jgi:glycosyltransferase involved in cell wall biosynthesis